ncbi:indole-3-glycerol phosphate synthase TrpC [Bizionia sp. KMM 8389]
MDILQQIVTNKRREIALKKQLIPTSQLEKSVLFETQTHSLVTNLKNSTSGIIAEFKRRSPSKQVINQKASIIDVAQGYEKAGVCGMSVLTDGNYFGGSLDDLLHARASCHLPLLRKDFIIDSYQIIEAKAHGADLILLIAAVLTPEEIKLFSELGKSLGLEILLEVHNNKELQQSVFPSLDLIGVNNRNLKTFEVSLETSKSLSALIPDDFTKISESGISTPEAIQELQLFDYKGFLIGENFMTTENPGLYAEKFIKNIAYEA